jgi:hypothetical protein
MPSISTENIHLGNSKAIAQFVKSLSMNNRKTGVQYAYIYHTKIVLFLTELPGHSCYEKKYPINLYARSFS